MDTGEAIAGVALILIGVAAGLEIRRGLRAGEMGLSGWRVWSRLEHPVGYALVLAFHIVLLVVCWGLVVARVAGLGAWE